MTFSESCAHAGVASGQLLEKRVKSGREKEVWIRDWRS
jgi:hypothetical protein